MYYKRAACFWLLIIVVTGSKAGLFDCFSYCGEPSPDSYELVSKGEGQAASQHKKVRRLYRVEAPPLEEIHLLLSDELGISEHTQWDKIANQGTEADLYKVPHIGIDGCTHYYALKCFKKPARKKQPLDPGRGELVLNDNRLEHKNIVRPLFYIVENKATGQLSYFQAGLSWGEIKKRYNETEEYIIRAILSPFIEGKELFEYYEDLKKLTYHKKKHHLIVIALQICETVAHLQKNKVIHRDIKLENFIIVPEKLHLAMFDFGFAIKLTASLKKARTFCGTPEVMAPAIYDYNYGPEVDLFSTSATLLEMATGRSLWGIVVPGWKNESSGLAKEDARKAMLVFLKKADQEKSSIIEKTIGDKWTYCPAQLREVILGLLRYNPDERISAEDAVKILEGEEMETDP